MKVTIVGPGTVGMTLAYTLMLRRAAREIVLVGRNRTKAEGEALDMTHAQAFLQVPVKIRAGEIEDAAGSDVVVICASVPVPEGITDRNEMAKGNAELMRELLPPLAAAAPDCKLVMVTNPVDPLTWLALELTGFPKERVMGTGTLVDSIRFRELLSEMLEIHPDDLRAYILGEHGDRQFPAMSVAQAGGEKIDDTPERRALCDRAKSMGIEVFRKKGNTCYAIGLATAYLVESILLDERRTMPVSLRVDGYLGVSGVCLSLPAVIGKKGIERIIQPELNGAEQEAFREAAKTVRSVIEAVS
ncbi:lactate dehydrogenase [Haloferula helveola]|uniref:Lactate dehydrogenase n=1 Tax=Haloferula helveola TaxID=490095 RepID=A0ABM7RKB0_9BACT|nr:lactate dehydrogenase [Haloferula helveola]